MKRIIALAGLLCLALMIRASGNNAWFVYDPCISPDAESIVFGYDNDLWTVHYSGGQAFRITAMDGKESSPRFSPDGKWIVFSGNADGNNNLYKIPVKGGPIEQLTWHSGNDVPYSWSWDSKFIYFASSRLNSYSTYKIPVEGGNPERLFGHHYWNNVHHLIQHPKDGSWFFSESGESYRSSNRKRYKGDYNPDIKYYNEKNREYKEITTYEGKDLWPSIDQTGLLFYASDKGSGEYNLFSWADGQEEQLTSFSTSISTPQVSANGQRLVFVKDYQLWIYQSEDGKSAAVPVSVYDHNRLPTQLAYDVKTGITDFDLSGDHKKLAFVSRGELFISDAKGQFIRHIETKETERVLEVKWSKDNEHLIYTRTVKGWPNLFMMKVSENVPVEQQITRGAKTCRMLEMNEDRSLMLYYSGKQELCLFTPETRENKVIVRDEFWFRGSPARFSPDNKYVVFTAYRHFEQDVLVYNMETAKVTNLTSTYLTETSPFWSPDGRHIYFSADRTQASYPRGTNNSHIYRIPLQKYKDRFRSEELEKVFQKKDEGKEGKKEEDAKEKVKSKVPENFDLENLLFRWERIGPASGQQNDPYVIQSDTVTQVIFTSSHEGQYKTYVSRISDFSGTKTKEIKGIRPQKLVPEGKDKLMALSRGKIYSVNLKSQSAKPIAISFPFERNLADEFEQMFYETWTILAENYYDENFHGTDWEAMRDKYSTYIPHVRNRDNLRVLLNDMLGELNSSHLGFSSSGKEEQKVYQMRTWTSGIIFRNDDPWVVDYIVEDSPADVEGIDIQAGDRLVQVNGEDIDPSTNREKYFTQSHVPPEVTLTFERDKYWKDVKIHPSIASWLNTLLYNEWINQRQLITDEKSRNRIAYVHLKNMGAGSLDKFIIEMTSEAVDRDALIVDLRYNTGGNIHDDVLQFLSQKPYLHWKFREGQVSPQPHFAPSGKPIVLLINEHSLSDAEMTSAGFKELGLGTIIGTESYRWIIFTSGKGLVDGSYTRLPAWGCYTLDGEDLEITGVKPDIYVENTFVDRLNQKDPQLEKAIDFLIKALHE